MAGRKRQTKHRTKTLHTKTLRKGKMVTMIMTIKVLEAPVKKGKL